jgi:hypothetical protein
MKSNDRGFVMNQESNPVATDEVVFSLRKEDLDSFSQYATSGQRFRWRLGISLTLSLVLALFLCFAETKNTIVTTLVIFLIGTTLIFLWIWRSVKFQPVELKGADAERFFAECRLSISPEGMNRVSEFSSETVKWDGIAKMAVTGQHAFLFVADNLAHILPRRAFPSTAQFESFIDKIRDYMEGTGAERDSHITTHNKSGAQKCEHIKPTQFHGTTESHGPARTEFVYSLQTEDVIALQLWDRKKQRLTLRQRLVWWFVGLVFLAVVLSAAFIKGDLGALWWLVIVFSLVACYFVLWSKWLLLWRIRRWSRNSKDAKRFLAERSLEISPKGIASTNQWDSNFTPWDTVQQIEVFQDRIFLFTTSSSAFVLPKRIFNSEVEFSGFIARVRRFRSGEMQESPNRVDEGIKEKSQQIQGPRRPGADSESKQR